ncbi:MAG: hypothetical protein H7Z12_13030 [Rhodospirillaceae bacterium]|nr:hypothetical protein [Rhodospirillales bacterium]
MLRNKQHSRKDPPPCRLMAGVAECDVRVEVLADLVDSLDLHSFFIDPVYRRRLNEVLSCFSDAEFDSFEQLYTRRFTVN